MTTTLPLFTDTPHCGQGALPKRCHVCRSRHSFRRLMSEYADRPVCRAPAGNINFDCPHGVEWINKPKVTEEAKLQTGTLSIARQALNVTEHVLHGAASIAKTSLGIDRATDEQVEARLNICRRCPGGHAVWTPGGGDVHTCGPMLESMRLSGQGTCGCILHKKARDLAEDCPFGWWPQSDQKKG